MLVAQPWPSVWLNICSGGCPHRPTHMQIYSTNAETNLLIFHKSVSHTRAPITHVEQVLWSPHCVFGYIFMCLFRACRKFTAWQISFWQAPRLKKVKHSLLFFLPKIQGLCLKLQIRLKLSALFL